MTPIESSVIIEISGMPGAGKTTTYNRMQVENMDARFGHRLSIYRNMGHTAFEILKLIPLYLSLGLGDEFISRSKLLLYLKMLGRELELQQYAGEKPLIYEYGPLSLQVFILAVGSSFQPGKSLESWIGKSIFQWSGLLSGIVWLDADDATLVERIKSRVNQDHRLKTSTEAKRKEFLEGTRIAYEQVIAGYEKNGIPVLRLSTQNETIDETRAKIEQFVSGIRSGTIPRSAEILKSRHQSSSGIR